MTPHRLTVLLLDEVLPLDFAIPLHVFAREAAGYYEVRTASIDGEPVSLAGGSRVLPDGDLALIETATTVLVPGYNGAASRELSEPVLSSLLRASARGARMASICSGAFALAAAGLLEGFTVTTHWAMAEDLSRGFPAVTVDAGALFVDNDTVLTSGGVTAGVDLALHILRKDLGDSIANHVARRIVMAPRPEGSQGQFSEAPSTVVGDGLISSTQSWMLASLDQPIAIGAMAAHAHLSPRQFHRRFVEATDQTPLAWLHEQRLGRAKRLLETSDRSIDEVARASGLGTAANFRAHFRRATGISPSTYRQAFWTSTSLGVA